MAGTGGATEWESTLADLEERRSVARVDGRRGAPRQAPGRREARRPGPHRPPARPGLVPTSSGTLVGGPDLPADAIVMGSGRIDGRPVMVAAEDFTVKAGTISQAANSKRYRVAEIALRRPGAAGDDARGCGLPGRRSSRTRARRPTCSPRPQCSGRVPLVTAVLGSSAGHGALVAPMSDFTVMSAHASIFTAGPPVVFESIGEQITKEDLGGPSVAVASGLDPQRRGRRRAALDLVRAYLALLPVVGVVVPARRPRRATTSGPRLVPEILDIVPRNGRRVYEMRDVARRRCSTPARASRCSRTSASR